MAVPREDSADVLSRLSCGHMGPRDGACKVCQDEGPTPDPWLIAGDDIDLKAASETRAYRQTKRRPS